MFRSKLQGATIQERRLIELRRLIKHIRYFLYFCILRKKTFQAHNNYVIERGRPFKDVVMVVAELQHFQWCFFLSLEHNYALHPSQLLY